ncbi:MAG: Na+/H+ antiporter subunit E [Pseudomonas sp.]|nr:Na+/H+ antiporter subunit E [Pseudomonas sp.]
MKRPLLVPLLPVVLTITWLLLNDSFDSAHLLFGIVLALLVSAAAVPLRPLSAWPRRLHVAIGLIWRVLLDIVRSNIGVGRIVLGAARRQPTIGFLDIPLDLRDPHGLAMLAIIITGTPGTVWSGYDPATNMLTLHVLDLQDEDAWIHTIKHRYERPLMEIFE